jgi:hypothetical protein
MQSAANASTVNGDIGRTFCHNCVLLTLCLCRSVYFEDLLGARVRATRSERLDHAYPHSICTAWAQAAPIVQESPAVWERVT